MLNTASRHAGIGALAFCIAQACQAQSGGAFTLGAVSFNSGAGAASGGPFALSCSIGQHDARDPGAPLSGGAFTLSGGFWAASSPVTPRCIADFNLDGFVDPDDLSDYIGCFFSIPRCVRADFNRDGAVDPDDLADFIASFFSGC